MSRREKLDEGAEVGFEAFEQMGEEKKGEAGRKVRGDVEVRRIVGDSKKRKIQAMFQERKPSGLDLLIKAFQQYGPNFNLSPKTPGLSGSSRD